jgi:hypothetical protein
MRRFLIPAVVVSIAMPAAPVHAQELLHLQPSTPWVLDYAEEHCRLARNFGDGDQLVTLIFDQFEPGDWFRISLTGKPVEASRAKKDAALQFGPHEPEAEITGTIATADRRKPAFIVNEAQRLAPLNAEEKRAQEAARKDRISFEPTPIGPAREAAAAWLELRNAFRHNLRLEIGPRDKPLAALSDCSWDTIRSWGLDVEAAENTKPQADSEPRILVRCQRLSDKHAPLWRPGNRELPAAGRSSRQADRMQSPGIDAAQSVRRRRVQDGDETSEVRASARRTRESGALILAANRDLQDLLLSRTLRHA